MDGRALPSTDREPLAQIDASHARQDSLEHLPASQLTLNSAPRYLAVRAAVNFAIQSSRNVLPGTHLRGVLSEAETARLTREAQAVDCVVRAGGVVAMRPLILHASSKAESDRRRRVLHIEYAESLEMAGGLELVIA
jgi:hypothetical protein